MNDDNRSLALFERATQMLMEADTIQKAKELKTLALTAADWARRKQLGDEAVQYAKSYAWDAFRKMGSMLEETKEDRADGGDAQRTRYSHVTESPPTLADLGISKNESSRAQFLAGLPDGKYEDIRSGVKSLTQVAREVKSEGLKGRISPIPDGKYRVIYADPPWKYNDVCDAGAVQSGGAEKHYPAMSISELCLLPIPALTEDNSVLFLWTTSPLIEESFQVVKAWGFKYKACFIWDKVKHNMGHYNSVRHEFLLICTKGSCLPDNRQLYDSVQSVERTAKHSEKPEEFRKIIDSLYPDGNRIELFARKKITGWETWGNEI